MKKVLAILLAMTMVVALAACGGNTSSSGGSTGGATSGGDSSDAVETKKVIKVGLLCIGDENDQGYSYNFARGRDDATAKLAAEGIDVEWVMKWNIGENSTCVDANIECAEEGCEIIFNNSYGFEPFMLEVADEYPNIQFVGCTNCISAFDGRENTHNAFADIYQGRYVAGVVAGMKIQQLIDEGKITADQAVIGYVGAYSFAEVISGMTSYYLGARSVCPSVTMKVQFVGSWSDATAEAEAAKSLCDMGCVMISQHSDNTTPATAAQTAGVFHTGYNADMTGIAPNASLISTRIDWSVYFYEFIKAYLNGEELPQDWCKGMADGAVVVTELNEAIAAPGTRDAMEKAIAGIKDGSINVFDTSAFTIDVTSDALSITSALAANAYGADANGVMNHHFSRDTDGDSLYLPDTDEAVIDGAFYESRFQSAPYLIAHIDGIEWLNAAY